MNDEILTLQEVAAFLKIGVRTAYRLVQEGKLPGFKVGDAWRFRRSDINAWISDKTASAKPTASGDSE